MTIQALRQPREVGNIGPATFNGLSALKVMGLDQGVYAIDSLRSSAATLQSLKNETHPEIFSANLLLLAQDLEKRQNDEGAARLYQGLQLWSPNSKWGKLAAHRQAVLNGQGSWGEKIERITQGLMPALTDNANLASMFLGLRAFRGVSGGVMKWLGGTTWSERAAASVLGYVAEVPIFTFSHRAVRAMEGRPTSTHWKDDFLYNAKNLGALKVFGLAGAHVATALAQRGIAHWAIPQTSMFLGVLGAQGIDVMDGTRKYQGIEPLLTSAATTWLHFNMFGKVLGPLEPGNIPQSRPRAPSSSPFLIAATDGGISLPLPFGGNRFRPKILEEGSRVYSKGSEAETPPSLPPVSQIPISEPHPRPSGVQPAGTHWKESIKESLGEITHKIYLHNFKDPISDAWASELGLLNFQLIRETTSILQKTQREKPYSSDVRHLRDIQDELEGISTSLLELAKKNPSLPSDHVKKFYNHFSKFPNLSINYIDGSVTDLGSAMTLLLPARATLSFLLQFDQLPKHGPFLGKRLTEYFHEKVNSVSGDFDVLYNDKPGSEGPVPWTLESSISMQELSHILRAVREEAEALGHPPILLNEMTLLHKDVEGIITYLKLMASDHESIPAELKRDYLINNLYQIPESFGNLLLESNFQHLLSARSFARTAQNLLQKNLVI